MLYIYSTLRNFQGEEGREQSSDLHPLSILLDGSLEENKGKNFKLWREQALIYGDNILEISLYLKLDNETPSAAERSQPGNAISWAGAFTEIAAWILQHATLSCHYKILAKFHHPLSKCTNFFPIFCRKLTRVKIPFATQLRL